MLSTKIKSYLLSNLNKKFDFFKKEIFFVNNSKYLNLLIKDLSKSDIIGIDTEFDWRKTYYPKLSLMQIVIGKKIYIVDCLSKINLKLLKKFLEDPNKLIVFHSSRSDTTVISSNLSIYIENIFDIQIADKVINSGQTESYASLVNKYLNIIIKKEETNSNWLRRPLTISQVDYAACDVKFLIEIYQKQKKSLKNSKKFSEVVTSSKKEAKIGNEDFIKTRIKRKNNLSENEKKVFLWREKEAKERNLPPSFIFKDNLISRIGKLDLNDKFLKKRLISILGDTDLAEKFILFFK